MKLKSAIEVTNGYAIVIKWSRSNMKVLQTDDGKKCVENFLIQLRKHTKIEIFSHFTSKGAILLINSTESDRNKLMKNALERGNANWIDVFFLQTLKQSVHSSTTITAVLASLRNIKCLVKDN